MCCHAFHPFLPFLRAARLRRKSQLGPADKTLMQLFNTEDGSSVLWFVFGVNSRELIKKIMKINLSENGKSIKSEK